MIQFSRLDHVTQMVPIGKKEEAKTFYKEVLLLEEIPGNHPRGAIWFNIGNIQLHIVEEEPGPVSGRHPAFEVKGLEAAKAYLESKGIEISYSSVIEGRSRCFFRDPFNNRIELLEYL
jgi:catechol 2,3-dioxygenase-like lactoylglutathione lyase family enzyme